MSSRFGIIYNKKQFEVFYEINQGLVQTEYRNYFNNNFKYNNVLLQKAKEDFIKFTSFDWLEGFGNDTNYYKLKEVFVYDSIVNYKYKKDFSIVYTLSEGNIFVEVQVGRFVGNGMNITNDLQLYINGINIYESAFPNNVEYDGEIIKTDNIYREALNRTDKVLSEIKI